MESMPTMRPFPSVTSIPKIFRPSSSVACLNRLTASEMGISGARV